MKVFFLFLFLACLFSNIVKAQHLVNLTITLQDSVGDFRLNQGVVRAIITDLKGNNRSVIVPSYKDGNFNLSIDVGNKITLNALCFNYNPKTIILGIAKDTAVSILMSPKIHEMKEVIVTDHKNDQFKIIPGGLSIEPNTRAFAPATLVSTYLKYIPGITVSTKGAISFMGRDLKVYIDDKLVTLTGNDLINYLQSLNIKDLGSIDILTEPGASFDAGSGSIINFHVKKFGTVGIQDVASIGLTTHDKYYINNSLLFTKKNLRISGNIIGNHSNFYENNYYNITSKTQPELNSTQYNNYPQTPQNNVGARLGFDSRISENVQMGFNLGLSYVKSNYTYDYLLTDNLETQHIPSVSQSTTNRNNVSAYLQYNMKKGSFQIDFSNIYLKNEHFIQNQSADSISIATNVANDNSSINHNFYVNAKQTWNISSRALLNAGIKYSSNNLNNNFTSSDSETISALTVYKEKILAAFIETSYQNKGFGFQLGLRAENTNVNLSSSMYNTKNNFNYLNWFPNVVAAVPPLNGVRIQLYFSSSITRPNYYQYLPYPDGFNAGSIYTSSGNISLLASRSYTFGFKISKQFKNDLSLIVNTFGTTVNSPILSLPFLSKSSIYDIPLNLNQGHVYTTEWIFSKRWKDFNLSVAPKYERRYIDKSTVHFDNQPLEVRLNGTNYFQIYTSCNFTLFKSLSNSVNLSYGTKQYSLLGYREPSGFLSYSVNKSFIKDRLYVTLEASDPFNLSKNYTFQSFNGLDFTNRMKSETKMLYLSVSFRFGSLKPTKTERHDYESDSRLKDDRL